jgi:phage/plasmid-associated DNA primase
VRPNQLTLGPRSLWSALWRRAPRCTHKFVFAHGTGANGKGTFINTIAGIFGDYATIADMAL